MEKNSNTITLENLLDKFEKQKKKFINELEISERNERVETLDSLIYDMKAQKEQTIRNKHKFINEMKSGLGGKIKENPMDIKVYTKPWYVKFGNWFKNIFIKF